jgi:hypothetical protein
MAEKTDKSIRGAASQYFVAGELSRRELVAVVTTGNCPNTEILCSNKEGTRFAHIQVKTFVPGNATCSVGEKAERDYGENFFWVLAGIPLPRTEASFVFYVIPSPIMSHEICRNHQQWLAMPGRGGQAHNPTSMRCVELPPRTHYTGWSIKEFENRWDIIETALA